MKTKSIVALSIAGAACAVAIGAAVIGMSHTAQAPVVSPNGIVAQDLTSQGIEGTFATFENVGYSTCATFDQQGVTLGTEMQAVSDAQSQASADGVSWTLSQSATVVGAETALHCPEYAHSLEINAGH